MAEIEFRDVSKSFGTYNVIQHLDVTIQDGSFTVLVGPSGCGKTTLLRMIAGIGPQSDGQILIDGKDMTGYEGDSIAAALKAAGVMTHRYTAKEHKPRGIFCAIGRCTDCVMIVNGQPNVRTCITPLEEGMEVQTQYGVLTKEEWEATL